MRLKERKYHYFYKITNNLNGHFYYGVHNTDNLDDGYMGSGRRLHYAYKKYGIENFTKEILKFFNTSKEAFEYEGEIVNETLMKDPNCYNIQGGGKSWNTEGLVAVQDKDGKRFLVLVNDERYLSGELISTAKGYFVAKDKAGKMYYISKNDTRYISGELFGCTKGIKYSDEYKQNMKLALIGKHQNHKTRYVCNEFEIIKIDVNNTEEYLNKGYQTGRIYHKIKQQGISEAHKRLKFQAGEKNSQYGTCWITKNKQNKKIKKEDLEQYIKLGWSKGRFIK